MPASSSPLDQTAVRTRLDRSGMARLLTRFSRQVEEAIQMGDSFALPRSLKGKIEKVVFVGMGGSAICGDVIRSLLAAEAPIPIWVSRHYRLPPFADSKTLCIFSSYSGNTEETLSAFREGKQRRVRSLAIGSGGELGRGSARRAVLWLEIPKGLPPRGALGYSVFPILRILARLGIYRWDARAVGETLSLLRLLAGRYAPEIPLRSNLAKQAAEALWGRLVVIYAGTELLDPAAVRFRSQIEENAKALVSHHLVPEMNHNEILGWEFPKGVVSRSAAVFLEDPGDHPRIRLRMKITRSLLKRRGVFTLGFSTQGKSRLARLFSSLYLGDWISYYLALRYGVDPTPVALIESLKKKLAEAK